MGSLRLILPARISHNILRMPWLKNILIDLSITILIVLATVFGQEWAGWIVIVYTPVMLVLKFGAFFSGSFLNQFRRADKDVPSWAYHVIYGLNLIFLAVFQWWVTALQWVLIWGLSVGSEMKMRRATRTSE